MHRMVALATGSVGFSLGGSIVSAVLCFKLLWFYPSIAPKMTLMSSGRSSASAPTAVST